MRRYSGNGVTPAGTTLTILEVIAATTTRGRIYEIVFSSDSAPADIATRFQMIRGTVSGTGTAFTPTILDPADPAALLSVKIGTFTGQTKTVNSQLYNLALNQRASYRWVAVPDSELIIPAVTDNWIGMESVSSGATPNIDGTILWQE